MSEKAEDKVFGLEKNCKIVYDAICLPLWLWLADVIPFTAAPWLLLKVQWREMIFPTMSGL